MSSCRSTKSVGQRCTARYPVEAPCVRPAEENSKWCSTHEEIEGKLLKLYKRHTTALESDLAFHKTKFSVRSITLKAGLNKNGHDTISLEELRIWYADARNQWVLATRTLETRIRHHIAFYSGGDAGHLQYLDFLRSLILDLEAIMHRCDELGYELLLQRERAKWMQCAPPSTGSAGCGLDTTTATDCREAPCIKGPSGQDTAASCRVKDQVPLTPPPSPTLSLSRRKARHAGDISGPKAGCQSSSCPDETACRDSQKRNAAVQRLHTFLQPESEANLRTEVFATFFRRVIARSPSLFMRARTWESEYQDCGSKLHLNSTGTGAFRADTVASFIRSDALTVVELERLIKKLPFVRGESMSAELIRGAIADVFRSVESQEGSENTPRLHSCIPLLGGWVYEKPWTGPMSLDAWDIMHQLITCGGCALGTARTFSEALSIRRLAFVGGRLEHALGSGIAIPGCLPELATPRFPRWQDNCSSSEIAMRILNVWLAADNRKTKRSELKKFIPKSRGMKPAYSEHEERYWMYMKMRWSEKRLTTFVASLDASEKFTVLAQRITNPKPTYIYVPTKETDAWVSRVRSGATPVARRSAHWTISTVFRMEIFDYFHKRSPEAKAGLIYLDEEDILEVVVMDNSNGEWLPFLQNVSDVLVSACGYTSLDSMLTGELSDTRVL